ncbi:AP-3 complex subunit delta-1 [Smittium culicis]|uniref:AP-3 complex subunit delta-1 n=1 Tax=Smittium culicis TaxID=133412 RepID=A0A1R1X671_9FUNG|nr:AP-3 complex subunit delta-1 [Smittium culicis]OMJ23194.1 AP-3 complex subunit delta-1 [Smittium culicis]
MFKSDLSDFIKGLRASKRNEDQYISSSIKKIQKEITSKDIDSKSNALSKLTYLQMLGYDMGWASFNAVEVMASDNYYQKRIGYLAAIQSFYEETDVLMLTTNLFRKDLASPDHLKVSLALEGLGEVLSPELCVDLLDSVIDVTNHRLAIIRKKAILVLHKILIKTPENSQFIIPILKEKLTDQDPIQYLGLVTITKLQENYPILAMAHFDSVLKILDDEDLSIRLRALNFIKGAILKSKSPRFLANQDNLVEIVEKLLYQLENSATIIFLENSLSKAEPIDYESSLYINESNSEDQKGDITVGVSDDQSYRRAVVQTIAYICRFKNYLHVSRFDWYISSLIRLTLSAKTNSIDELLAECILDVITRVKNIRKQGVTAMFSLIVYVPTNMDSNDFGYKSILNSGTPLFSVFTTAAYIIGEYGNEYIQSHQLLSALYSLLGYITDTTLDDSLLIGSLCFSMTKILITLFNKFVEKLDGFSLDTIDSEVINELKKITSEIEIKSKRLISSSIFGNDVFYCKELGIFMWAFEILKNKLSTFCELAVSSPRSNIDNPTIFIDNKSANSNIKNVPSFTVDQLELVHSPDQSIWDDQSGFDNQKSPQITLSSKSSIVQEKAVIQSEIDKINDLTLKEAIEMLKSSVSIFELNPMSKEAQKKIPVPEDLIHILAFEKNINYLPNPVHELSELFNPEPVKEQFQYIDSSSKSKKSGHRSNRHSNKGRNRNKDDDIYYIDDGKNIRKKDSLESIEIQDLHLSSVDNIPVVSLDIEGLDTVNSDPLQNKKLNKTSKRHGSANSASKPFSPNQIITPIDFCVLDDEVPVESKNTSCTPELQRKISFFNTNPKSISSENGAFGIKNIYPKISNTLIKNSDFATSGEISDPEYSVCFEVPIFYNQLFEPVENFHQQTVDCFPNLLDYPKPDSEIVSKEFKSSIVIDYPIGDDVKSILHDCDQLLMKLCLATGMYSYEVSKLDQVDILSKTKNKQVSVFKKDAKKALSIELLENMCKFEPEINQTSVFLYNANMIGFLLSNFNKLKGVSDMIQSFRNQKTPKEASLVEKIETAEHGDKELQTETLEKPKLEESRNNKQDELYIKPVGINVFCSVKMFLVKYKDLNPTADPKPVAIDNGNLSIKSLIKQVKGKSFIRAKLDVISNIDCLRTSISNSISNIL